jgi:hypothetical protein
MYLQGFPGLLIPFAFVPIYKPASLVGVKKHARVPLRFDKILALLEHFRGVTLAPLVIVYIQIADGRRIVEPYSAGGLAVFFHQLEKSTGHLAFLGYYVVFVIHDLSFLIQSVSL